MNNVLSRHSVLVSLRISQWTAEQTDRQVSAEVASDKMAARNAGRYRKKLLPGCKSLNAVHKMSKTIGKKFVVHTLPWGDRGTRVLPTAHYMEYMQEFRDDRAEWMKAVDYFIAMYQPETMQAKTQLGQLFNARDYPSQGALQEKFDMDMSVLPYPDVEDFRITMCESEMERIRAGIIRDSQADAERVTRDLWNRLHGVVSKFVDRLSDPKNVFHNTMIGNVQELCGLLKTMNVTNDPDLERMRVDVLDSLGGREPDTLRNDVNERAVAHSEAERIMRNMQALMPAA